MKKEISNMITDFKLFEVISTEDFKPSYLMTQSEYKEKVTPILKSFNKFISKNTDYLRKDGYFGIYYITWDEFLKRRKEDLERQYPGSWERWGKESTEKDWMIHKSLPNDVKNIYNEYISIFSKIFGTKNLKSIQDDEIGSNKRSVRRALDDNTYIELLKDEKLEYKKFEEILTSVGLKIPAGFNKKLNFKPPTPKPIEKTKEEKELIASRIKRALDGFKSKGISYISIGPRMTRNMFRISYSDVSMFKYIVDNWNFLDTDQQSEIESNPDYVNYIRRAKEYIVKAGERNIEFAEDSVYTKIIEEVKVKIQPVIDEQKEEIKNKIIQKQYYIKKEKADSSEIEFQKKWSVKSFDRKGNVIGSSIERFYSETLEGKLLKWNKDQTDKYIKEQQDMYQEREHSKLQVLFYRLKSRYPNIVDFKFRDVVSFRKTGIEFFITGYDSNDVEYRISTKTIFAGGYNIQKYHMRWLMDVYIGNERVATFKSENTI